MNEMKTLNGFEIVDAKAREDIETIKNSGVKVDLTGYATESYVEQAIEANIPDGLSSFNNDMNFVDKSYVDTAIGNIAETTPHYVIGYPTVDTALQAVLDDIRYGDLILNQQCTVAILSNNIALPVTSCTYGGTGNSSSITFFCTDSDKMMTYFYRKNNYVDGVGYTWVGTSTGREDFASVETVNTLINDALGVIENGTY
jgi:hypothetical protein